MNYDQAIRQLDAISGGTHSTLRVTLYDEDYEGCRRSDYGGSVFVGTVCLMCDRLPSWEMVIFGLKQKMRNEIDRQKGDAA